MAERIVSPGVFTKEIDQSFLPAAIAQIGAAIVGPTLKGPAYTPTQVSSFADFETIFGGFTNDSYVPLAVQEYLRNGNVITITRTLYEGGYSLSNGALAIVAESGSTKYVTHVLHPTQPVSPTVYGLENSGLSSDVNGKFALKVSGSYTSVLIPGFQQFNYVKGTDISASINPSDSTYIKKVLPKSPKGQDYPVYIQYEHPAATSLFNTLSAVSTSLEIIPTYDFSTNYNTAATPWITSQKVGSVTKNLFRFHSLSHGTSTNYELKVGIYNIKTTTEVQSGADGYPSFSVVIRKVDTTNVLNSVYEIPIKEDDSQQSPLVTFENVNLNPASPNYIAKVVGDRYQTIDNDNNVSVYGDYVNTNQYVRVEVAPEIASKSADKTLFPFGFRALMSSIPNVSGSINLAPVTYKINQDLGGSYNASAYHGFDFTSAANINYLAPIPKTGATTASNVDFYLGDISQSLSAGAYTGSLQDAYIAGNFSNVVLSTRKFIVPFQGGFDGARPNLPKFSGANIEDSNTFGFDCSGANTPGTNSYKKAFALLSNTDYYDMNMLLLPGIIDRLHPAVSNAARNLCLERQDVFYVMDSNLKGDSLQSVIDQVKTIDNNYAATYWPWLSINNPNGGLLWVPPSVVVAGVLSNNDRVSAPWYAPAGLNRGIAAAVDTAVKLSQANRDTLYENRVNPIASFPNQQIVIWGQKTLQGRPSALDRVNVRRLLIEVKKFIASATRFLVFEQNTDITRQRFLSIANPYLEGVQRAQGLSAFRVVMDSTNNTPDLIDRNILYGQLFLQPTRTAEFIILDFNIQSTGAAFPGGQ